MKRRNKSRSKQQSQRNGTLAASQRSGIRSKAQVEQLIKRLKRDLNGPLGMKFIKTVFYPEIYKARIPYSLNNQSTALVSHIEELDINSGPDGAGMLFYFPKITNGPCLFQYLSDARGFYTVYKHAYTTGSADKYVIGSATTTATSGVVLTMFSLKTQVTREEAQVYFKGVSPSGMTSLVLSGAAPSLTSSKYTFLGPIDNVSPHPMFLDFAAASVSISNAPQIPTSLYPNTPAALEQLNSDLQGKYNKQTSLVTNFNAVYPILKQLLDSTYPDITSTTAGQTPAAYQALSWFLFPQPTATGAVLDGPQSYTLSASPGAALLSTAQPLVAGQVQSMSGWSGLSIQNYSQSYDKVALTGSSLTMEYVGRFDYEAGYISASHLEDMSIDQVTTQDIDKGQFQVKAKPNEGLRMVWQPTQQADFELFFTSKSDQTSMGARILSYSQQAYQKQLLKSASELAVSKADSLSYRLDAASQCIALYWKGLAPGQQAFRLNITRRFNMIPQKALKAVADMNKPDINIDPALTMQKVFQLTRLAPFGGSTLADAQLYNGVRQNFINALELNPNIKFGSLKALDSVLSGDITGDPAADDD